MKTKQTKEQIIDNLVSNGITLIRMAGTDTGKASEYRHNYIRGIYNSMRPGGWYDHRITKEIADAVAKRLNALCTINPATTTER